MTLSLKQLIDNLKSELRAANESTEDPMFILDKASIKTRISVVDKTETNGGVEIYVASAGVQAAKENTSEHEITIDLKALGEINLGDDPNLGDP